MLSSYLYRQDGAVHHGIQSPVPKRQSDQLLPVVAGHLQVVIVILTRQGLESGLIHLLAVLLEELLVDLSSGGSQGRSSDEFLQTKLALESRHRYGFIWCEKTYKGRVANELPGEPEEGLLEVVVGLGRDIVVLKVLLAVEGNGLGLDLALLHVNLVAAENNRDVLANTDEVT